MSFFVHPHTFDARHHHPYAPQHQGSPFGLPAYSPQVPLAHFGTSGGGNPGPGPQFNFYHQLPLSAQAHQSPYNNFTSDLEAEEIAARRHLAAIQRRRAEAEAAAVRAAAIERERREAAVRAELERERQVQIEQRHREIESRRQAYARAVQERQREYEQYAAFVNRVRQAKIEESLKRKAAKCAAHCARRAAQYARQEVDQARQTERPAETKSNDGFDEINSLLASLFGIALVRDNEEQPTPSQTAATNVPAAGTAASEETNKSEIEQAKSETTTATQVKLVEQEAPAPTPAAPAAATLKTAKTEEDDGPAIPAELNDLLSTFLGLRVEPTSSTASDDKPSENRVPQGLNELLGKFGLVFEPDTSDTPAQQASSTQFAPQASSSTSQEKKDNKKEESTTAPLTDFLNGFTDLPPFVRDILENVELGFKEGTAKEKQAKEEKPIEGKGKAVAEGEKTIRSTPPAPTVPAPAVPTVETPAADTPTSTSSTTSLASLDDITAKLHSLQSSFTFPDHLAFASSDSETPNLLFNKHNSPYHAQAHSLLQLLLAADGVSSEGDKEVRRKRKAVVKEVEGAIEELEKKRDEMWEAVRERREKGEVSDWEREDSESSSSGSSVVGDVEHIEHVEESHHAKAAEVDGAVEEKQVDGFEIALAQPTEPTGDDKEVKSYADIAAAHPQDPPVQEAGAEEQTSAPAPVAGEVKTTDVDDKEKVDKEKRSRVEDDKEEGYELI